MGKPGQDVNTGPASQREDAESNLGEEPICVTAWIAMVRLFMLEFAVLCIMAPLMMLAYVEVQFHPFKHVIQSCIVFAKMQSQF